MSESIYILGAARTPVGSFQGSLASQSAPELGAHAIAAALVNGQVDRAEVNEVIIGNVVSSALKQAPARQAMRIAELPDSCAATNPPTAVRAHFSLILAGVAVVKHAICVCAMSAPSGALIKIKR